MNWKSLEQRVRDVAALQYARSSVKETINGVNLDCVIKLDSSSWVVVEVSKRRDLDKVRTDINRLILVKRYLYENKAIMSKCYFVCLYQPTPAMIEAGAPHHIDVISHTEFERSFFDYGTYVTARSRLQFGSSVHPVTGDPDDTAYVPVKYEFEQSGKEYDISDIEKALTSGALLILTGEYGSGKSRCLREVFLKLAKQDDHPSYFLAIDLKTTWGLETGEEIIRRHFTSLGLSVLADFAIRAFHGGHIKFILDGFDEVGSQAWSDDPATLKRIRRDSLRGVRDLIKKSNGGVLIAGRDHYFNTNEEMLTCLGIETEESIVGSCKREFDDEELEEFLNLISEDIIVVPEWLPRRPLMCQAIASLDGDDLRDILGDQNGDIDFWKVFIDIICRREARIRHILDANAIKGILIRLARITRAKKSNVGPVTYGEIQDAFETVLGTHPVEEASVILQRLPGLGRTSRESDDRQFIDSYVVDGLRALDLVSAVQKYDSNLMGEQWSNPLDHLGQRVFAHEIADKGLETEALNFAHNVNSQGNKIAVCDIVSGLLWLEEETRDFRSITVSDGEMVYCDLSHVRPTNLTLERCIVFNLVFPSKPIVSVQIVDCEIGRAYGVSGPNGVPDWVVNSEIERYQSIATVSAIKNADLSPQHRILVTILKKTFFQPGGGRQEAALLRGLGQVDRYGYTDRILQMLISEGLLIRTRGKHGNLYIPERKFGGRVAKLLAQLNLSEDPLWRSIA